MKRVQIFLLVMVSLCLNSCNSGIGKVKIGYLIHTTNSSRWVMDIAYMQQRAKELNVEFVLKDAGGDENVQLKQALELLKEGVDVLVVVAANQNTAAGIVREAHNYKVPVIAYDRMIKNSDLDYIVSFEYEKVGELMANYSTSKVPEGKYVILWGDASDGNALAIKRGQEKALAPYIESGKVEVVYKTFIEGWTDINGKHQMDKILDLCPDKVDVVIASNDPIALGAYSSLTEHGYKPGEVILTGQDATVAFAHSMLKGGVTMSVYKPIKELAYGAVDLAIEIAKKGTSKQFNTTVNNGRKDVPAKLYAPSVVDKMNIDEKLISSGMYKREQIYNN